MPARKALCDKESEGPSPKRLRSSVSGSLHNKTKCVWCMQGEDTRHPNRVRNKLFRINTQSAWRAFKRHTVLIENEQLRDRLTRLIESTSALSDPFANDIMYHHVCWMKHIHNTHFKPDDAMHLQSVSLSEAKNLFFRYVDSVISTQPESTICLPPDDDSLNLHMERSNYLTYCQLHYNLQEHPSPIGQGWELVNGKCRPVRHTLPPLPQQLTPHDCSNESSSDDERSQCGDSTDSDGVFLFMLIKTTPS